MVTDAFSGAPARILRSRFAEEMERERRRLPNFPRVFASFSPSGTPRTRATFPSCRMDKLHRCRWTRRRPSLWIALFKMRAR